MAFTIPDSLSQTRKHSSLVPTFLHKTQSLGFFLLVHLTLLAAAQNVPIGQSCNISRNRVTSTSHQLLSDCIQAAYCDPVDRICKPKGCRSEEFPFGYGLNQELPPMCQAGTFCPDEESRCLPLVPVGGQCQLNRDDQCQPPPNAADLSNNWNHNGAICLQFTCFWANASLIENCAVDNTVYTGYRNDGSEFASIVSRDNCKAPDLWCNSQSGRCQASLLVGESCQADKMCKSRNCALDNICHDPPILELHIPVWQYSITGLCIAAFMLGILVLLFLLHRRHRAEAQREMREYYHEQTTYRSSIIALHTAAARDRKAQLPRFESQPLDDLNDAPGLRYTDSGPRSQSAEANGATVRLSRARAPVRHDTARDGHTADGPHGPMMDHQPKYPQGETQLGRETQWLSRDHGRASNGRFEQYTPDGAVPWNRGVPPPPGTLIPNRNPFRDPYDH